MSTFAHVVGWAFVAPVILFFWIAGIYAWADQKITLSETLQYWTICWTVSVGLTFAFVALEGWM